MKEPVDHILRPQLPWRDPAAGTITECGYGASKVATLTSAAYFQRLKDYGQQRTAMMTCMTCSSTAARWGTWDDDPRQAIQREIEWECRYRRERGRLLADELIVIADLIAAHREEFDARLSENARRREWIEKKAESTRRAKVQPTGRL